MEVVQEALLLFLTSWLPNISFQKGRLENRCHQVNTHLSVEADGPSNVVGLDISPLAGRRCCQPVARISPHSEVQL